MSHISVSGTWL